MSEVNRLPDADGTLASGVCTAPGEKPAGWDEVAAENWWNLGSNASEKNLQPRCFRILGFTGPEKKQFTLLVGFEKITGSEYAVECPKALQRKKGVLKDGTRAPQCYFP